ncbi:MAG TPA: hypothetical protein VHX42_01960 [Candidatus Babeliales bacterium]|jgi:hypothetical protein|nr:hypothetical protein [Candidatus Babeliales bacterium]
MKKYYIGFLILVISTISSLEQEQELILLPKNKKKYVSQEQCIDLKINSIMLVNEINRSINALRQTSDIIQKDDLDMLSDYADGEKSCFFKKADKVGLTNYYEKEMKKNQVLERSIRKIKKIEQDLHSLHREMQKIQHDLLM